MKVTCRMLITICAMSGCAVSHVDAMTRSFLDETSRDGQLAVLGDSDLSELMQTHAPQSAVRWKELLEAAADDREAFRSYLEMTAKNRVAFSHSLEKESVAQAAGLAVVFRSDKGPLTLSRVPREELAVATGHAIELSKLAATVYPSKPTAKVAVFALGAVSGVTTGGGSQDAPATGTIGIEVEQPNRIWNAAVNVASTVDTVDAEFGEAVLLPANGSALASGFFDVRSRLWNRHGFRGMVSLAKSNWLVATSDTGSVVSSATVVGLGGTVFYDVLNTKAAGTKLGLTFEAGLSGRWLTGDVGQNRDLRQATLGTTKTFWGGLEAGGQVTWGIITGSAAFYLYPAGAQDKVSGLTRGQFAARFSVQAPIWPGEDEDRQ